MKGIKGYKNLSSDLETGLYNKLKHDWGKGHSPIVGNMSPPEILREFFFEYRYVEFEPFEGYQSHLHIFPPKKATEKRIPLELTHWALETESNYYVGTVHYCIVQKPDFWFIVIYHYDIPDNDLGYLLSQIKLTI